MIPPKSRLPELTMRQNGSRNGGPVMRRAWKAPQIITTAIRAEAQSAGKDGQGAGKSPPAPAAPASKLGFSFEMAFPLSARMQ
jgi:hypothetical protein